MDTHSSRTWQLTKLTPPKEMEVSSFYGKKTFKDSWYFTVAVFDESTRFSGIFLG